MPDPRLPLRQWVGLVVAILFAVVAPDSSAAEREDRWVVRIALENLPVEFMDDVDPCAIDRDAAGEFAVMFLTPERIDGLTVPHEVVSRFADHARPFLPLRTMGAVGVPSLEGLADAANEIPPGDGSPEGGVMLEFDRYHTLQEGVDFLEAVAEAVPEITSLVSIGQSLEGRDIWALKVSDHPDEVEPDEERILFTGVTHAREWATHEMMLYMTQYLTTRYAFDPEVQRVVDNSVVWLVPVVNPDGYQYTWDHDRLWRKNRRINQTGCEGVDINRNYAFGWGGEGASDDSCSETYRGASPASEPETAAIQNVLDAERFAIAVSYHTFGQLVLYPWGGTTHALAESHTSLRAMGNKYATLAESVHGKIYRPGQGSFTLYVVSGDFNDYAYGATGALALTPELRPGKASQGGFLLPEGLIQANNEENMSSALWLMKNVADATAMANPHSDTLFDWPSAGHQMVSLPGTPVNQKPGESLGLDSAAADRVETWLDDLAHQPPAWGMLNSDFEGCGAGSGYVIDHTDQTLDWLVALASYKVLPNLFDDGADVMLSNMAPGMNVVGLPGTNLPVLMRHLGVARRTVTNVVGASGTAEVIEAERTALEDLDASDSWIDWTWEYVDPQGVSYLSHPVGVGGADEFIHPFRAYYVYTNVPSWDFGTLGAHTHLLRFPGSVNDCDHNGIGDAEDIAERRSTDCNGNEIPDVCESLGDVDGNGHVDLLDYESFQQCLSGPGVAADSGCERLDIDSDGDVDLLDYGCLSHLFTGDCAIDVVQPPPDRTVCPGATVILDFATSGPVLTHQWYHRGTPIDGATNATVALTDVSFASEGRYRVEVTSQCETIVSDAGVVTVHDAPAIVSQTGDVHGCNGTPAELSVEAAGVAPLSYQWRRDNVEIPGATSPMYTLEINAESVGTYRCKVTDDCGSGTFSAQAIVTTDSPTIETQPVGGSYCVGETAFLFVESPSLPVYQWYKDGGAIEDATGFFLAIPNVTEADAGLYRVGLTNACGTEYSNDVLISIEQCGGAP